MSGSHIDRDGERGVEVVNPGPQKRGTGGTRIAFIRIIWLAGIPGL